MMCLRVLSEKTVVFIMRKILIVIDMQNSERKEL